MAGDIRASVYGQLVSLFGGTITDQIDIYPDAISEKAQFPAIMYRFESIKNDYNLDGQVVFSKGNVIFHSFSYDKDQCVANALIIKNAFSGLRGPLGDCYIGWSFKLVDDTDAEMPAPDGSQKILYEDRLTFYTGWN